MQNDLDQGIRAIFGRLFRVDGSTLEEGVRRGELDGWDSLAHLDLVAELETGFSVTITPEQALEIETLGDAKRIVAGLLNHG